MVVTSDVWNGSKLTLNDGAAVLNIASIPSGDAYYFSTDGAGGTDIRLYAAPVLGAPQVGGSASNFITIDDPSTTHSGANGINDSGTIVGSGALDANHDTGWEYNGTFSLVGVAGAQDSDVNGINDSGEIAGFYSPERSTPRYGFIDNGGTYSQINVPPGTSTTANINDNGVVVGGSYLHTTSGITPIYTGFIDDHGTITYLNAPGTLTSNGYTYAYGINDSGEVVGSYETSYSSSQQHGFLYQNGTYTTIDDPNAGSGGTYATGINNSGIIVGNYSDSSGLSHGFVDINGTFTTVDDPLGAKGTQINGINNAGQIVGDYFDSNNVEHGFVASLNGVSTAEDRALTLTSLSVSDAGSGSNPILVTLDAGHGTLTLSNASGLSVSGQGTDDLTLTGTASEIAAALAAGVIYAPTLGYAYADVLTLTANDQGHNATGTPLTTTQDIGVVIAPEISIANGGSYEVTGSSSDTIAFAGNTGTLTLDHPSSFTGELAGSFAIGDIIDLAGLSATDTASTGAGSFNSATDETTLTVKDSGGNVVETFVLAGDHSSSSWTVTSDSHGGIDVVDPPASGAKDAPATATAAPGNDHVAASASQNETAHVANPVNEAGFGSDQSSAVTSDIHNGSDATPATNTLAPATAVLAPDSGQFTGALGEAFGGDQAATGNSSEADAAALTNGLSGGVNQTLLSSLLNVLTNNTSSIAAVAPNTPVLDSEHVTNSIVDGSGAPGDEAAHSTVQMVSTNEIASSSATSPAPTASPTVASATFGASGDDNFAFHPNLGSDTAQNTGGATNELAHNNVQIAGPAPASTVPEFHQEFAFDAVHHDDAQLALTLDQLHQMAASSTLLH
jgi:probable HAF family extracellular repeat protein